MRLLGVAAAVTACGGPSFPAEPPTRSPVSARAQEAPLPRLGSSVEDTPLGEEGTRPMDHGTHGGMGHDMPPQPSGAGTVDGGPASPDPASREDRPQHGGHP